MGSTKQMTSRTQSATFPSPGTPPYRANEPPVGTPKGWCSERVPAASYHRSRRQVATAALMPLSSGRALPSKWDDAERWISSPVNHHKNYYSQLGQRRAKSKSGPLGPVRGFASYNSFSPVLGLGVINDELQWRNSVTVMGSPAASVQARLEQVAVSGVGEEGRRSCPGHGDPDWLDLWSGPPTPTHKGNSIDDNNYENGEGAINGGVSRRDMATQMFAESDQIMNSPTSAVAEIDEVIRDVQVDEQTSQITWSNPDCNQVGHRNSTTMDVDKITSKLQREEARIKAWENLQKAKAEAAILKLETRLEKKRSSSMEKITDKLRRSEIKAEKMRSSLSIRDDKIRSHVASRTTSKIPSFCKKIRLRSSTRTISCSTCYPF